MDYQLCKILDKAFNQMSDIALLFEVEDGLFRYVKANHAAYKAGYKDDYFGKFVEQALPEPYASNLNRILKLALSSKESIRYEDEFTSSIGGNIGDILITPIFDDNGRCTHVLGVGRDITERKKREGELNRTKSFLESILSSTTDGILVTDIKRNIIAMNAGFTQLFGWEQGEVIGKPFSELHLVPEGLGEEHEQLAKKLLAGINIPAYRTQRQQKDGSLVYVNASYSPLKDEKGDLVGLIAIYRDITDQVKKDIELEKSKQRYQSIVKHHPDAVFQFDLHGKFLDANHALEKVTGYSIEELKNQSFVPLVTSDTIERTLINFQATTQGETRNYEAAVNHKQRKRIDVQVTNIPITVNGEITGVFGIAKDITEQKRLQDELIKTKETLESFFNHTADAIDIIDLNHRVVEINPAFESMYGYSREEVIGHPLPVIIPERKDEAENLFDRVLKGDTITGLEIVNRRKDGSLIDVSLSLSPIRDAEGNIVSFAAITGDISEKKQDEKRIQESEALYRLIAENMKDLITLIDETGKVLYASPSHKEIFGIDPKEIEGTHPFYLIHEEDQERFIETFRHVISTGEISWTELRFPNKEQQYVWLDSKLSSVYDHEGNFKHVLAVSRDITERKNYEAQLERMAFYDYLTGVSNRRLFMDRLEFSIAHAKRHHQSFALLSLDFDRFKWVNDTLGHDVGDELLIEFVQRVKKCIREVDTLARLGGDEFMVLIPYVTSQEDLKNIADRILTALQVPWNIHGHEFVTTSSIGIAIYPQAGTDITTLMKHADQALYKAKQFGRNNYQFYLDNLDLDKDVSFKQDVVQAIAHKEFYLVYQPKFKLASKELQSIEVLVRWNHPKKGLLLPDQFILRVEELDLIVPMTFFVLKEACLQNKKWQELGYKKIPVSVNISAKHFDKGILVQNVREILSETGLDPEYLILEITESAMIQDLNLMMDTIEKLRKMGIKIAVDDFGKGYSSLSYLMKLQVDELKLDKSFVQELTNKKNASIVNSIVSLAHDLNLTVVAEGIETEKQHQLLMQYGCDLGQGYFYSKPLMEHQLETIFFRNESNEYDTVVD